MPRTLAHQAIVKGLVVAAICSFTITTAWTHPEPPATPAAARLPAARPVPYLDTVLLEVDATDLDRRIFRVRQTLPVQPGALTLLYPRWLPGTHGPYGNASELAGLRVLAGDRPLAWTRNPVEPHAFHVEVPAGVQRLVLDYQHLSPTTPDQGRRLMTPQMLNLQWDNVVLYPAGHEATHVRYQARVKLPAGWQPASALKARPAADGWWQFDAASLETLVDSPVFAGRHVQRVPLDPPGAARPVTLHLFADEPEQLQASEAQLQAHRALVQQADRLFGQRHFRHYDFLLALSDTLGRIGLEHHESSENGVKPHYFKDWHKAVFARELLPHEYVHSWNGKFRRPAELLTPDFNTEPMRTSLLWLYEGQTQYWGRVLAARSGLVTAEQARDGLARAAAWIEHRSGRQWRNLQDTTYEATLGGRGDSKRWSDWQRSADYYDEAALVWLEADALIRAQTQNQRSLDDFARAFFGAGSGPETTNPDGRVKPQPYTFDDVVQALNRVWSHDWRRFLRERLDGHERAPLQGLAAAGWQLVYAEQPSEAARAEDADRKTTDFYYSLGLRIDSEQHSLKDVRWDSPAFHASLAPGMKLVAVNQLAYKPERLASAITANKNGTQPIELLVRDGEQYKTVKIDYRGGLKYPRLERLPNTADRLSQILAAKG